MKNALAAGAVASALFAVSGGVALAEGINLHLGAGASVQGDQNENEGSSTDQNANENEGAHATSTPWLSGEKEGLQKHFGTTTPPGITRSHATGTDENGNGKGGGHGNFISNFFQWLFGLPATTTVGDIRAAINASSTASTSPSQGLGFWARFFGFFHFGKGS